MLSIVPKSAQAGPGLPSGMNLPETLGSADPRVSVVVTSYGDDEYVGRALRSVAAQTFDDLEVVLVDGTGVDRLASLADETDWIRYVYQEPRGPSAARNRGISAARGELVAMLDADDYWREDKLEHQLEQIQVGCDVVYSDAYIVDSSTGRTTRWDALPVRDPRHHHVSAFLEHGVPSPTVLCRRDCVSEERFDESIGGAEDWHLWVRLFRRFRPGHVAEPLAYHTKRPGSVSSDLEMMYRNERRAIRHLASRFAELRPHLSDRLNEARYVHGRRLLEDGRRSEARRVLVRLLREAYIDRRVLALLAVSVAPVSPGRTVERLSRIDPV